MRSVLDVLLSADIPAPQTKEFKQKRLSEQFGEDVVLTLQEIGFSRVAELKRLADDGEMDVHIVLAGVAEPNFKDKDLLTKYGVPTPAELVKKLFLPGEITDIAREIEKLSGFRVATLEEIRKK